MFRLLYKKKIFKGSADPCSLICLSMTHLVEGCARESAEPKRNSRFPSTSINTSPGYSLNGNQVLF